MVEPNKLYPRSSTVHLLHFTLIYNKNKINSDWPKSLGLDSNFSVVHSKNITVRGTAIDSDLNFHKVWERRYCILIWVSNNNNTLYLWVAFLSEDFKVL